MKRVISNPVTAARVVQELIDTALANGVTAWIQDGTLLGAVREGGIIPWDTDLDVGVYSWEYSPALDDALLDKGFEKNADWNERHRDYHQKWIKRNVKIDIFHYYRHDSGAIYHGLRGGKMRFYYPAPFEFAQILLHNVPVSAPFPPEQFLRIKYGSDWRTPRERWNCSRDPSNAAPVE